MKLFNFIATRFNIYYCLLTLNRSIAESWWLLDEAEASKAEQTHAEFLRHWGQRLGVPIANILLTFYGWKFMEKQSKRVRDRLQPPKAGLGSRKRRDGHGSWRRATSRLTVWLSFLIYPMRYLRLMCLKVNTMLHSHTHTLTLFNRKRGKS